MIYLSNCLLRACKWNDGFQFDSHSGSDSRKKKLPIVYEICRNISSQISTNRVALNPSESYQGNMSRFLPQSMKNFAFQNVFLEYHDIKLTFSYNALYGPRSI